MNFKKTWNNYKKLFKEAFRELKTKGERHKQIPNILTVTRLIAAPIFILPAFIIGNVPLVVLFTVFFSLTDALDGFIARKYNLVSELGKDLDALCDKIFAGTLLIGLSVSNPVLLFNLFCEVVIGLMNAKEKIDGYKPRSLYIGKIKTCFLYPLLLVSLVNQFTNMSEIFNVLFMATATMQLITVATYATKYETTSGKALNVVEEKIETIEEIELSDDKELSDELSLDKELTAHEMAKEDIVDIKKYKIISRKEKEKKEEKGYQKVKK